ncbi:hypothetical protein NPIL_460311 [Nephila pilipes]|uniref:Uncharacterized protein n=1 Tax=Nephila pilipes TaxID=299642 RepID=A0A8X6N3L8_NEPPI|nr:hypothetical protein NPIL_460311 [Nephila pilipes]
MANRSPEFMFVRDAIRYVLSEYWTRFNWTPSGIFVHQNSDSPFNSAVQRSLKNYLDTHGWQIHEKYCVYFQEKKFSAEKHYELCRKIIENQNDAADVKITVLKLCAIVSYITAVSVHYGTLEAPEISHSFIFGYYAKLRKVLEDEWYNKTFSPLDRNIVGCMVNLADGREVFIGLGCPFGFEPHPVGRNCAPRTG